MMRRFERRAPSAGDLHRQWLELVDTDGPFLAVPALTRVYGSGIPQPDADAVAQLKAAKPAFEKAWEAWDRERDAPLDGYRAARDIWVQVVLRDVLGWAAAYGPATGAAVRSPDHAVAVTATGALTHGDVTGALVLIVDPVDSLRDPLTGGWATSPIDRMEELLRAASVPTGVVTDGRWWAIVSARPETMVASGIVDSQTWVEEPPTRNAFVELLSRRRLVAGRAEDRLTEMYKDSVAAAEEITEALGVQVRRAVELLVQALSEAALDARDRGEPDPLPAARSQVYEAAVTVMMRVVFLLFAEERGLLPHGRLFAAGYGISSELEALKKRKEAENAEALDATHLTWHRLLATSLALYRGASFEDLRLPAYGGSLFDPDRFVFLTARSERGTLAVTVSDRAMLEVLLAVQVAKIKGQPARQISFRDIDVEQIGYIYEGLLGYSCELVEEVIVGLIGKKPGEETGEEPELSLRELEAIADALPDPVKRADAILARVMETQPAASPASRSKLVKAIRENDQVTDAEGALRRVTKDARLRERLRPFVGIIRRDLRSRPFVVQPGGLVVVETPSRATAGAHYTPRSLAEEVVKYALEPLVFEPGPHQKPDSADWKPLSSDRLLDLKIADIACGSGAFLVAAARYLAARLVEAYHREGVATGSAHDLHTQAIRKVVANCLYGADINDMAVEMCKLSLWLVSLDPKLPFSFVDDKVLHGNSLLGLIGEDQLKFQHINPDPARGQMMLSDLDIDGVLARAVSLRRRLATEVDDADPQRSAATKRRQWREYQELTTQLADVADGVVAAGLRLGGKPGRALREAYENLHTAVGTAYPSDGLEPGRSMLDSILDAGLTPTVKTDYERWRPLHWVLAVPDVMDSGGFDAIIGNPPFRGGQFLTGDLGTNIRDWFVNVLAAGTKGSADQLAYFLLRAASLLQAEGNLGLVAIDTVWQGATRKVGLDQLDSRGFTISHAVQSRSWPVANVNLRYAAIWGTFGVVADLVPRIADDVTTVRITTLLEPAGRTEGLPIRLAENSNRAFQGCIALGLGFELEPETAAKWIEIDPRNADVIFPYPNGSRFNSSFDGSYSRWIIDFNDRSESAASTFRLPYGRVLESVKLDRSRRAPDVRNLPWWQFLRRRPAMREAIEGLDCVIAIAQTSATLVPLMVSSRQVFDQKLVVFASSDYTLLALLSSSVHQLWAICWGSARTGDPVYTPTTVFDTFPQPESIRGLSELGEVLNSDRRQMMLGRKLGLTDLYNLINDPELIDPEIAHLRQIHAEIDNLVMAAYGWEELALDHGFHTYRQMSRWTVSPTARVEILDRLLKENHRRAATHGEAPPPADAAEIEEDGE